MNPRQDALTHAMVEVLETLWTMEESSASSVEQLKREAATSVGPDLLESLKEKGLIETDAHGEIRLLPQGRDRAREIIRRHRLGERLLCDALGVGVEDTEDSACEFEHLLADGITNSICTLLGHPRFCPHNRPIPEGDCCRQAREDLKPIVFGCDQLAIGESARIAYLCAREHALLSRLSNLGVQPGVPLRLLQKWPSYVIQCEETEIALEESVARCIYVRR